MVGYISLDHEIQGKGRLLVTPLAFAIVCMPCRIRQVPAL
jgi:hypothetical protein